MHHLFERLTIPLIEVEIIEKCKFRHITVKLNVIINCVLENSKAYLLSALK